MSAEKHVDESWKEAAAETKSEAGQAYQNQKNEEQPFDFRAYITSLTMQALIFLGVMGNPMADNKVEVNLEQARLLIDTLAMLKEKTQGNLTKEEEDLINASVYELQVKYVDIARGAGQGAGSSPEGEQHAG
ncbi:MAG: DUF1844 domain-containing protein [Candidatus Omnitrophota bacterium]